MESAGPNIEVRAQDLHHKCSSGFLAINVGISYGNGHTVPSVPRLGRYEALARLLMGNEHIQRLAAYQNAVYALWHPEAYIYYKENLDKLHAHHPEFSPSFRRSIMPTVAFNIGKNAGTTIRRAATSSFGS
ncbi:hypothetical protein CPB83DRAFT_900486 [Crepidotus variabilis]|uniref:Uncharacterized protein n=1 Tax=Crepidotus variabilis TaxID=179855 RepID=A0A9P6E338_9AGAR|nr:hypothetical protein CPB83DRAFT_900486 [Crepidotus variabilis]